LVSTSAQCFEGWGQESISMKHAHLGMIKCKFGLRGTHRCNELGVFASQSWSDCQDETSYKRYDVVDKPLENLVGTPNRALYRQGSQISRSMVDWLQNFVSLGLHLQALLPLLFAGEPLSTACFYVILHARVAQRLNGGVIC
jgi:hypothetical protein